jgi:SNF2 family DNA or RNA helicase
MIWFLLQKRYAALFVDMGLGKTIAVLTAIVRLLKRHKINNVLIVAPIRVIYAVWRQEAKAWSHTKRLKFSLIHGTVAERLQAMREPAHIYLTNPDNLKWLKGLYGTKPWPWDMLVVDESSMFKKANTRRFKSLKPNLKHFKRRVVMTGTPTPNSLLELWSQIYIVDHGYSLGTSFTEFKQNNFYRAGYKGYQWLPQEGAEARIVESIGPRTVRLDAADWLKLPPIIEVPVWCKLPAHARQLYRQAETRMFLDFEDSDVEFVNAASLSNSCCQIASGAVWTKDKENPEKKVWVPVHDAKLDALRELIDELQGEPPLIAYRYQHDLERLRAAFPRFPVIGKGTTPKQTDQIIRAWNARKLQGVIIHPQSGGHGLNMQGGGRHLIWFSTTWSLELYQQLVKRLHRGGITKSVIVYLLLMEDTVEETIVEALEHKDQGQQSVNNALREYYEYRHLRVAA